MSGNMLKAPDSMVAECLYCEDCQHFLYDILHYVVVVST